MPLALVCFFFEADAAELAKKAGREATKLYQAEHGHVPQTWVRGREGGKSLIEKLEDTLLHISKLVDPIKISRVVRRLEEQVYNRYYYKDAKRKKGRMVNEAKFFCERFLVLNVIAFYGCLEYLVDSIS